KILARALELPDRAFGGVLELAPTVDQELPVLRTVARLPLERFELVLGAGERPGAEGEHRAVVGDPAEELADGLPELLDLLAGGVGGVELVDRAGAVVEFLAEVREAALELGELAGEFIVRGARRRAWLGLGTSGLRGSRDNEQQHRSEQPKETSRGAVGLG